MKITRKVVRTHFWKTSLLSGFLFVLFLSACDLQVEKEKVEKMLSDTVFSEYAENVEMRYSDSGRARAVLYAPVLERFQTEEPYTTFEQGVTGYFYGPSGRVENSLKAKWGISYDKKKLVEMRNDVQLINFKQEKLNTDKLIWDQKTGKIYTDAFVKITTPENIIMGEGFEANQDFTEYKIFKVKGEISVDEKDQ
ncbi:MAG: LPS export ABC transporter periplasmic protein LptC [Bacteroidota bacterium]|nr:LPS export ABC transporter periplasmic protein LptC [Bacteroidota bacterium]MDX5430053.1 LPS export ABC transporter periplasmic protein LptC [Bacteroidota bacterium]MDX5468823.1 LPS export ABC transporter periplasmic protein LptC [Bacteroidota bacterium]